jgi:hypothetical protein
MRETIERLGMAAILVGFVAGVPSSVAAQDDGDSGPGGVINLQETVIEGNIQKPEAFYILQHSNLNYESLEPKPSFIPQLLESVEKEPF